MKEDSWYAWAAATEWQWSWADGFAACCECRLSHGLGCTAVVTGDQRVIGCARAFGPVSPQCGLATVWIWRYAAGVHVCLPQASSALSQATQYQLLANCSKILHGARAPCFGGYIQSCQADDLQTCPPGRHSPARSESIVTRRFWCHAVISEQAIFPYDSDPANDRVEDQDDREEIEPALARPGQFRRQLDRSRIHHLLRSHGMLPSRASISSGCLCAPACSRAAAEQVR